MKEVAEREVAAWGGGQRRYNGERRRDVMGIQKNEGTGKAEEEWADIEMVHIQ